MTKILVIEDETMIRDSIFEILSRKGYEVTKAENGQIGVELAQKELPDLIICDVMMPVMNGFDVLVTLRGNPRTVNTPFIFLTAQADREDFRKGMGLGADDYLTKPFEVNDLLTAIETRLAKQAATIKKMDDLRLNISAMLPHELRTPLTGILGVSQLLMSSSATAEPEFLTSMGEMIHANGLRLQRLIENYILYTQLKLREYASSKENKRPTNQHSSVEEIILIFAMNKVEKLNRSEDVTLNLVDAETNVLMEHLRKLIEELVDNALKFSEPGSLIQITTKIEDNYCILSVSDQGRGMTEKQISEIGAYQQFEREEYEQQGSGLGLILVTMLAELYDGDTVIDSQPNQGTTVTVTFKLMN